MIPRSFAHTRYAIQPLRPGCFHHERHPISSLPRRVTTIQLRHKTTSSTTAASVASTRNDTPQAYVATRISGHINELVNPPSTTRPPPFTKPVRDEGQALFSYLFKAGKTYLGFYKEGLKSVWANHKAARAIGSRKSQDRGKVEGGLTRAEFQLLRRNNKDMARLPIFALLFLMCGEYLPVIVIYVTAIVPGPCRIPAQLEKIQRKAETRRRQRLAALALQDRAGQSTTSKESPDSAYVTLSPRQLHAVAARLGLYSPVWDAISVSPPSFLLRWHVGRRTKYLDTDDALIRQYGGVKDLIADEVKIAASERGMDVLGKEDKQLRGELEAWIGSSSK